MFKTKRPRGKLAVVFALVLSLTLTGCGPISSAVKSVLADDTFPKLPSPEITTYILDLSGSTNALAQMNALNSGIDEFVSGKSLGNPFSIPKIKPLGLSMQFITLNSGQAPRFLLVSAEASQQLYSFILESGLNVDTAKPLWEGFIRAREIIYDDKMYEDMSTCPDKAIEQFGRQALKPDSLQLPAIQICKDALNTAQSLEALSRFNQNPKIPKGSDVFGALKLAITNMNRASKQFKEVSKTKVSKTIAIASDMQHVSPAIKLSDHLGKPEIIDACDEGRDFSNKHFKEPKELKGFKIILVGLGNTSMYKRLIEENRKFWNCYFENAGADVEEATDLAGY